MADYDGIDHIVSGSSNWYDALDRLKQAAGDPPGALAPIIMAMLYHFPSDSGQEAPFGPFGRVGESRFPPPIAECTDEQVEAWIDALAVATDPIVRSRLADLLWVRRVPDAQKYARIATTAYRSLAECSDDYLFGADSIRRSIDIARMLNDVDELTRSVQCALELARKVLDQDQEFMTSGQGSPGATLRILERLVQLPKDTATSNSLADLLDNAAIVYVTDIHVMESIRSLQSSLFKDDKLKAESYTRAQVQAWIESAKNRANGLLRLEDLKRGRELALSAGFTAELAEIRSLTEGTSVESLDLKEMSTTIEIPDEQISDFKEGFLDETNLLEFLNLFGEYLPIPTDLAQVEHTVQQMMADFPFQFMIRKTILNESGLPIKYINSADEHFKDALRSTLTMNCQIWLGLAAEILTTAVETKASSAEDVSKYFTTPFIPSTVADTIVRALNCYRAGRYDECACILIPRIEGIIRSIAREMGISIYSEPQGDTPGGYKQLGSLLNSLQGKLPENVRQYMLITIGDALGMNVRNRLCHGLLLEAGKIEAVLGIHLASLLVLLTPVESSESNDGPNA